jgi:hypothetical protein
MMCLESRQEPDGGESETLYIVQFAFHLRSSPFQRPDWTISNILGIIETWMPFLCQGILPTLAGCDGRSGRGK